MPGDQYLSTHIFHAVMKTSLTRQYLIEAMLLKVIRNNLQFCVLMLAVLFVSGCSKTGKNGNEVYRILHNKQIVKIDSIGPGLAKFQIKPGSNTVFSYNKISSDVSQDTIINRSESIIFQIPSDIDQFDYTGVLIDSAHAFYMSGTPGLVQYPASGGELRGHKMSDKKWQIELSLTINTGDKTISRHVKHDFSVSPYGEDSLQNFSRKPQIEQ